MKRFLIGALVAYSPVGDSARRVVGSQSLVVASSWSTPRRSARRRKGASRSFPKALRTLFLDQGIETSGWEYLKVRFGDLGGDRVPGGDRDHLRDLPGRGDSSQSRGLGTCNGRPPERDEAASPRRAGGLARRLRVDRHGLALRPIDDAASLLSDRRRIAPVAAGRCGVWRCSWAFSNSRTDPTGGPSPAGCSSPWRRWSSGASSGPTARGNGGRRTCRTT